MGAAIAWFGRLFVSSLSGLGFFSLFGVGDDDDNSALTIALGAVSVVLAYLLLKKK
mgnify:FL=1|jgi:hypothetical protein